MHPEIERELTTQRIEDLRRAGAPRRRRRAVVPAVSARGESVVIRIAHRADRAALAALAALDGALPPIGGALVAEVKGSIVAALPLGGGRPFPAPLRHTNDLLALLQERAKQNERERGEGREHRGLPRRVAPAGPAGGGWR